MKPKSDWILEHSRIVSAPNLVLLREKPERWDEYLDINATTVVASSCQDWLSLGQDLWRSGLSPQTALLLLSPGQEPKDLRITERGLGPQPDHPDWALVWNHPEQALRGRHYVITRASDQGAELTSVLQSHGASVRHIPCLEFGEPDDPTTVEKALEQLETYQLILFTSKNAVRFFVPRLRGQKLAATLACIGPGTAQCLEEAGYACDLVAQKSVAEGLLETLEQHFGAELNTMRILLPRAQVARETLPQKLRELGAQVTVAPVYKTICPPKPESPAPLHPESRILFSSASTVKNWDKVMGATRLPCYCLGPVTAEHAQKAGFDILAVAETFTLEGLVKAILQTEAQ